MKISTKHLDELESKIAAAVAKADTSDTTGAAYAALLAKASRDCAKARNELAQAEFFPIYGRFTKALGRFMEPLLKLFEKHVVADMGPPPPPPASTPSDPSAN
jgi:hypothetical protein